MLHSQKSKDENEHTTRHRVRERERKKAGGKCGITEYNKTLRYERRREKNAHTNGKGSKKTKKKSSSKQSFMLYIKINAENTEYEMQKQPSTNKPQT